MIAICSGSKKSMEILFNVQPTLRSKSKIVPDLSEHDCTIVATKFWRSLSCQLKKMDVVHALSSL
jgi:hypothetical protein